VNYDLVTGIKWYVVFLFSTTLHEAAHAWAALKLGDDTAARGGQVTLDPTPHLQRSPFGMVVVPIVSYLLGGWMIGWASAPFDPRWAAANPRKSALMSLAGPGANFLLVLTAAILIRAGIALNYFSAPETIDFSRVVSAETSGGYFFSSFLSIFFSLNLLLCAFNLLPIPPLDGSGALMLFAGPKSGQRVLEFLRNPQFRIFGLFVAWKLFDYVFPPLHILAVNILYLGNAHFQT
jgi:Zn-dependent protease